MWSISGGPLGCAAARGDTGDDHLPYLYSVNQPDCLKPTARGGGGGRQLVEADPTASSSMNEAARQSVRDAEELGDLAFGPQPSDVLEDNLQPNSFVALWFDHDAQFFINRIDSFDQQVAGDSLATPSAAEGRNKSDPNEVRVKVTSMFYNDQGDWVEDKAKDTLYGHQLKRIDSVVAAADREASLRSGFAIDVNGREIKIGRYWCPVAVHVTNPIAFQRQLYELVSAINIPSHSGLDETNSLVLARPVLLTHFHEKTKWTTNTNILVQRCKRHIALHPEPPSRTLDKIDGEPDGWRCDSWDVVKALQVHQHTLAPRCY